MGTLNWPKPRYSRAQVDRAGQILLQDDANILESTAALDVLNNWRSSHSFPLNTFQVHLRNKAREADPQALVAQRLKRVSSTVEKLRRLPTMRLSRMQDIGGCRAVVNDVAAARELAESFQRSGFKHVLCTHKDYIGEPKESGYRSIHLVYRYCSGRNTIYNNHLIEVQVRSRLQHAWATAVETVGTFLGQALKSSEGSERWLRFFALTSSAFAIVEKTPSVPGTPQGRALIGKVRREAKALQVSQRLHAYGLALKTTGEHQDPEAHCYLLSLRPSENLLEIITYRRSELDEASRRYLQLEELYRADAANQTVLVQADSIGALRSAYPNYFLDTQVFAENLAMVCEQRV